MSSSHRAAQKRYQTHFSLKSKRFYGVFDKDLAWWAFWICHNISVLTSSAHRVKKRMQTTPKIRLTYLDRSKTQWQFYPTRKIFIWKSRKSLLRSSQKSEKTKYFEVYDEAKERNNKIVIFWQIKQNQRLVVANTSICSLMTVYQMARLRSRGIQRQNWQK